MSSTQRTGANNPKDTTAGEALSLEELNFIVSILFLIGSGISVYIAYKNFSNSTSVEPLE
ncbi:hypothetical protein KFZ58_17805 [Virgibacillus sp. NKC19-16]|uniref:hypothetical protein n=1 Tax=Virgibacillus salidurans TaxID=2831673 RepID=UPI001F2B4EEF|nr:hypothetical protein [Virgibacillus sp. NKC19-16]UJL46185.1 hypothetical protein KFZ58_17805 [Virgibacillus sp. NKC19-16]